MTIVAASCRRCPWDRGAVGEKGGNREVRRLVERRGRAERGSRVVGLG